MSTNVKKQLNHTNFAWCEFSEGLHRKEFYHNLGGGKLEAEYDFDTDIFVIYDKMNKRILVREHRITESEIDSLIAQAQSVSSLISNQSMCTHHRI